MFKALIFLLAVACAKAQDITGWATCDNEMWLYADGVEIAHRNDWTTASHVSLPAGTQVVGIKCQDHGGIASMKAAFDNGQKTDGSWKCSTSTTDGWNMAGFDDNGWSPAVIHSHPAWGTKPSQLNGNSHWIWTADWNNDNLVYCRKDFTDITGWATCDNEMWLYADGVEIAHRNDWTTTSHVSLPADTQTVGIKCQDHGGIASMKAAFDNGQKTDDSWKCSTSATNGWNMAGFDDNGWSTAVVHTHSAWGTRPSQLNGNSNWIWTADLNDDNLVYCRKDFIVKPDLPYPQLRVTFNEDKGRPLTVEGRPYNLAYRGEKNPVYEEAPIKEGLVLDGNYYLEAIGGNELPGIEDNCITDIEQCEGFTLSFWIKPKTPWEGKGAQYIVSMGEGVENSFGVKVSIRRRNLFFMVYTRQQWRKVQCKIDTDYNRDAWMYLALKGNGIDKPIVPFWNGDKMKDCTGGEIKQHANVTVETVSQILVGSRQDPETQDYVGFYQGDIDDLQWFSRALEINEIRDIFRQGKDFLPSAKEENVVV